MEVENRQRTTEYDPFHNSSDEEVVPPQNNLLQTQISNVSVLPTSPQSSLPQPQLGFGIPPQQPPHFQGMVNNMQYHQQQQQQPQYFPPQQIHPTLPLGMPPVIGYGVPLRPTYPNSIPMGQQTYPGVRMQQPVSQIITSSASTPLKIDAETSKQQVKDEIEAEKGEEGLRSIGPWTEHTSEDGKTFYFNKETNQSVWEKPDEFKDEKEKLLESCDWKAYTTDEGKEYYHNEKLGSTQWEMPEEYRIHLAKVEELVSKKGIDKKLEGDMSDLSKEERTEFFVLALKRAGVHSSMTQEDAFNLVHSTSLKEWNLLKFGEKRAAFNTYISDLKSQEQKELKKKEQQIADEFIQVLFECEQITRETKFRDAMAMIATHPKFLSVPTNERERLFYIFLKKKEEKILEEERKKKKEARDTFLAFLESSSLSLDTLWRDFKESKKDEPVFQAISVSEALEIFQSHLKDIEKKEEEELKIKEKEILRKSRKAREQFRKLLDEELQKGEITRNTHWSNFKPQIEKDERYLAMTECDIEGSTPAEIFYDVTMDLDEKFAKDAKRVKHILKDSNFIIDPSVKMDTFIAKITDHPNYENIDEANVEPIFHEMQQKSVKEAERNKATAKKKFQEILMDSGLTKHATWEMVNSHLYREDIMALSLTDEEKKNLFEIEMKYRDDEKIYQKAISIGYCQKRERKDKDRRKSDKHRDDKYDADDRYTKRDSNSRSQTRSPSPKHKRRRSDHEDKRESSRKHRRDQ